MLEGVSHTVVARPMGVGVKVSYVPMYSNKLLDIIFFGLQFPYLLYRNIMGLKYNDTCENERSAWHMVSIQ